MCTFPLNYLRKIKICRRTRANFFHLFSRNFSKLCLHPLYLLGEKFAYGREKTMANTYDESLNYRETHTQTIFICRIPIFYVHTSYTYILFTAGKKLAGRTVHGQEKSFALGPCISTSALLTILISYTTW